MTGFTLLTKDKIKIRFRYYLNEAPLTSATFNELLPFKLVLYHARVSGQEFWAAEAHAVNVLQENASVFTLAGEAVLGPLHPKRTKTSGAFGIYYGEGKGLDAANIFAKVLDEDVAALKNLGEAIWKNGQQELHFEKLD